MDQICEKMGISGRNEKSGHHHWILHTQIRLGVIFLGTMALLGQSTELTIYGTARPRAKFTSDNAMVLLGQVKDS